MNALPPPLMLAAPLTHPLSDRRKGSETRRERAIDVLARMWDGEVGSLYAIVEGRQGMIPRAAAAPAAVTPLLLLLLLP